MYLKSHHAWILLITLFIVFILDDSGAWRIRKVRLRVRRIGNKIRQLARRFGKTVKKTIKTITKAAIIMNPKLFVAKTLLDVYKKYTMRKEMGGEDRNLFRV